MPAEPPSPNRIMRIAFGFQASSVLLAASKLDEFGLPRSPGATGNDLYGYLYDSEAHLREFASSMTALNMMAAPALARAIGWKRERPPDELAYAPANPGRLRFHER